MNKPAPVTVQFDGGPIHGQIMSIPKLLPFLTFRETQEETAANGVVYHKEKSLDRHAYVLDGRFYRYKGMIRGVDIHERLKEKVEQNDRRIESEASAGDTGTDSATA